MLLRLLLTLVLLWAGPVVARDLDAIRQSGVLRVGVNPNFPPMSSYGDGGTLQGFDVNVARELGRRLGVRVELVPTEAASRVPFLVSGRIDHWRGSLRIPPEPQRMNAAAVPVQ